MDKQILHSVLETLTAGNNVTINFNEPFTNLSGDYTVVTSKTGRGRGGSRVIEIAPIGNPTASFGALAIEGKEKALGTGTSEYINTIVSNGETFGLEEPSKALHKPAVRSPAGDKQTVIARKCERVKQTRVNNNVAQGQRVAKALGDVLVENACTSFRLIANSRSSSLNGEWRVASFEYADSVLTMQLVDIDNAEHTLAFDSTVHGAEIRDAQVIGVEN